MVRIRVRYRGGCSSHTCIVAQVACPEYFGDELGNLFAHIDEQRPLIQRLMDKKPILCQPLPAQTQSPQPSPVFPLNNILDVTCLYICKCGNCTEGPVIVEYFGGGSAICAFW